MIEWLKKKIGTNKLSQKNFDFFDETYNETFYQTYGYTDFFYAKFDELMALTYLKSPDFKEAVDKVTRACLALPLGLHNGEEVEEIPENLLMELDKLLIGSHFKDALRIMLINKLTAGELFLLNKDFIDREKFPRKIEHLLVRSSEVIKLNLSLGEIGSIEISEAINSRLGVSIPVNTFETIYKQGMAYNPIAYNSFYNPVNLDGRGIAPAQILLQDIEILVRGKTWNKSVINNEGRPSGVFFYPANSAGAINPAQRSLVGNKSVEQDIADKFAGSGNAGKVLLLKGGIQFKEISYKMKDVDFISGLKVSREAVANFYGIPLQLFGSQEKSSYNNQFEARQAFMADTCIPYLTDILDFLNYKILKPLGFLKEKEKLIVWKDKTDIANQLRIEKMLSLDKVQYLTLNEKREMVDLKPVSDMNADKLLVTSSLTPVEDLGLNANTEDEDFEDTDDEPEGEQGQPEEQDEDAEN